jgi:hypothetical protein
VESLGPDFDTLLTRGALGALATALLWATSVLAAVALEAVSGGRVRLAHRTGCPAAWRAWLLGVLVVVFAGLGPAQATESQPPGAARALDGLPLPDRAVDGPRSHRTGPAPAVVIVRPGDSLWLIARRLLPEHAANGAVASLVAQLHARNRAVIGADPDLIRPGQRLAVPADASPDFPAPTSLLEEP